MGKTNTKNKNLERLQSLEDRKERSTDNMKTMYKINTSAMGKKSQN